MTSTARWADHGAGRALGLAFARGVLGNGDHVVASARRPNELRQTLSGYGDRAVMFGLNVSAAAEVR